MDIALIVVSQRYRKNYPEFKRRFTLDFKKSMQWCLIETLDKKQGMMSVLSKIVQSMSAKVGVRLFSPVIERLLRDARDARYAVTQ